MAVTTTTSAEGPITYTWPRKACPCRDVQRSECQTLGCEWERDPSLVPEALREHSAPAAPAPSEAPVDLAAKCADIARHLGDGWLVIGPDGSRFQGPTPHSAANAANKHRTRMLYDPAKAAEWQAMLDGLRATQEAAEAAALELYGSLNCPACGGSGHVEDATAPVGLTDEQIDAMLHEIDYVALNVDIHKYGLPMDRDEDRERMRAAVRRALAAHRAEGGE